MAARREGSSGRTTVQKKSDREVVVTRTFDAPARLVFEAWSRPELFKKWWVPRSLGMTLRSCEMDVRTGGAYRLEFGDDPANPMAFFGEYLEVVPNKRIVWTNEESGDAGSVTTVTLEERDGSLYLVVETQNSASERHLERAVELLKEIRDSEDPVAFYDQLILAVAPTREVGVSGLGLARIRAEGELFIDFRLEGDVLTICAETPIAPRELA